MSEPDEIKGSYLNGVEAGRAERAAEIERLTAERNSWHATAISLEFNVMRLMAENKRLKACINAIDERHSRVGDMEYDDVIKNAMRSDQQSTTEGNP